MLRDGFQQHLVKLYSECQELSSQGQSEYTQVDDAFDNFNRLEAELGLNRKHILFIYLKKHLDGILRYIKGHRSQRESIHGRIKDAIVYLSLLDAMIFEDEKNSIPNLQDRQLDKSLEEFRINQVRAAQNMLSLKDINERMAESMRKEME